MRDQERWLETARNWVHTVERAYVAAAFGPAAAIAPAHGAAAELAAVAAAAAGAVASRFLAVGTPRSIGLVGDPAACALSLAAHRVWFQPADIRWASSTSGDADRAAELGGRAVSQGEALAADIVCLHAPLSLEAARLRRGTHVNALAAVALDDELRALATIIDEPAGLPALAAGLRDGRQLDELTVFLAGDLAIACRALASYR
jgi:ornithine cyclodeaminase/alanine dehydrogenase-like protein (mu-crystallin family)